MTTNRAPALLATALLAACLTACGVPVEMPAATPSPTPTASAPASPAPTAAPSDRFVDYIEAAYPGVSWVRNVTGSEVRGGTLWISTDLYPDADATAPARAVCVAARAYAMTETSGVSTVTVRAADGTRIAKC